MLPYNRYQCWTCGKYHKNGSKAQERCEQEEERKKKAIAQAKLDELDSLKKWVHKEKKRMFKLADKYEKQGYKTDMRKANASGFTLGINVINEISKREKQLKGGGGE